MTDPTLSVPTTNSTAAEWLQWHKTLLTVFSLEKANSIWVQFWAQRGNGNDDKTLRDYMTSQGVDIQTSVLTDVIDTGTNIAGEAVTGVEAVGNAVIAPFKAIGSIIGVGKWVALGFVVIILGSVSLLIINIARKPVETIGAAKGLMGK